MGIRRDLCDVRRVSDHRDDEEAEGGDLGRRTFVKGVAGLGATMGIGVALSGCEPADRTNPPESDPVTRDSDTPQPAKRILILGAGFGGLETATGLASSLPPGYQITLVDRSDSFFIGFSKIDVLFGRKTEPEVRYRYENLRAEGVRFVQAEIQSIDTDAKRVSTTAEALDYDYLVVALGADLDPDATAGFVASGGHEFYSMPGANALRGTIEDFASGTLVLAVFKPPYKCPPAPYEVACQLHDHFVATGRRDAVSIKFVIPGGQPVKNPRVSAMLEKQLTDRDIELVKKSPIRSIDPDAKQLVLADGTLDFDLLVGIPVHVPPPVVRDSKLSDGGFVRVDQATLETAIPGVFAVGDVTKIPVGDKAVPKAGAFAEDAARTVVAEILRREGVETDAVPFEAHGACYFELGDGAIAKIDANYLGGEKPAVVVEGPTDALKPDKEHFASSRRARWFDE
jgi:sulfide:quinone oxidoreductase